MTDRENQTALTASAANPITSYLARQVAAREACGAMLARRLSGHRMAAKLVATMSPTYPPGGSANTSAYSDALANALTLHPAACRGRLRQRQQRRDNRNHV